MPVLNPKLCGLTPSLVLVASALALTGAISCATAHEPGRVEPAPPSLDSARAPQVARVDTMTPPVIALAPAPAPAPVITPVVVATPKPKPKPKPKPVPPPAPPAAPTLAPAVVVATPKPRVPVSGKPMHSGLSARGRFVRDSIARAALVRDSLARAAIVRDSLERERFVRDSLARAAFGRDSLARVAFLRDSLGRAAFLRDSLARAAVLADSLAKLAHEDSAFGPEGAVPRIQGDPYITKPTAGVELDYVAQVSDNYWQLQFSYARPFEKRKSSWEIDLPFQYWESVPPGKTVTGLANMTFIVNRLFSARDASWQQIASITFNAQTGIINPTLGNNQWIFQPQYAISHWFVKDRLQARLLLYWQYGFFVDSGTTKKNILIPRLVANTRLSTRLDAGLDYRPRFDFQRNQFYSTLQLYASYALTNELGLQAGWEFPLDSLGKQRVEKQKLYVIFSRTFEK